MTLARSYNNAHDLADGALITGQALASNAYFQGAASNVTLKIGTANRDQLRSDVQADQLYGENGDDTMVGSFGADLLDGGSGADVLYGDLIEMTDQSHPENYNNNDRLQTTDKPTKTYSPN